MGLIYVIEPTATSLRCACFGSMVQKHRLLWREEVAGTDPTALKGLRQPPGSGDEIVVSVAPRRCYVAPTELPREHGGNVAVLTRQGLLDRIPFLPPTGHAEFWQRVDSDGPILQGMGVALPEEPPLVGDRVICAGTPAVEALHRIATATGEPVVGLTVADPCLFLVDPTGVRGVHPVRGRLDAEVRRFLLAHDVAPAQGVLLRDGDDAEAAWASLAAVCPRVDDLPWPYLEEWRHFRLTVEAPFAQFLSLGSLLPGWFLRTGAVFLAAGFVLAGMYQSQVATSYAAAEASLDTTRQTVLERLYPGEPPPRSPVRAVTEEIDRLRIVADRSTAGSSSQTALGTLALVSEGLGTCGTCALSAVSSDEDRIVIQGNAPSLKALDELRLAYTELEALDDARIDRADQAVTGTGIVFELTLSRS